MRAGLTLAAALAVAAAAFVIANGFMGSFNTPPEPELAARSLPRPEPVDVPGRTTVVVVDGLRLDRVADLDLAPRPALSCELEAVLPSYSRPAYVTLSIGVEPLLSGVRSNDHEGPAGLASIWDVARRAGLRTELIADGTDWWIDLFPDAFDATHTEGALDEDGVPLPTADVALVHLVHADDVAHDHGVLDGRYAAALALAGGYLRRVLDGLGEGDTLWITSDHGHIDRGGHGGPEPEVLAVPLLAYGAVAVARDVGPCRGRLSDLPATLAAHLGLPPPPASMGAPVAALAVPPEVRAAIGAQVAELAHLAERRPRPASPWLAALAVLLWALLALALRRALALPWRPFAVATLALPALGVGAWLALEPTLSLSAVWLEGPWVTRMTLIFVAVGAAASAVAHSQLRGADALTGQLLGAALPFAIALGAHGALGAGPTPGDPHAAYAIILCGLFATVGAGVAALACGVDLLWRRSRQAAPAS